ncbi:hypothetical protein [Paenibacillus filicis]|uniref:hypothetical protein n=1 Tax=Paenibacillus filicis TaxID=669464 RepID=UPI003BF9F847
MYIYLTPIVTVWAAYLFLNESITMTAFLGMLLTLIGLVVSEKRFIQKLKLASSYVLKCRVKLNRHRM